MYSETIFLLSVSLSIGDAAAIFDASENIQLERLIFIESERSFGRKSAASFTCFGGILSATVAFLVLIFLEVLFVMVLQS